MLNPEVGIISDLHYLGVGYTFKAEQRKSEREPGDPLVGVNQEDRCLWRGHLTQVSVKAYGD